MIVCYILNKTRNLGIKFISDKTEKFKYNSKEYNVIPNRIYNKKFLFIKKFNFSLYLEDIKEPLLLDHQRLFEKSNINVDDYKYFIKGLEDNKLQYIALIISAITLLLVFTLFMNLMQL